MFSEEEENKLAQQYFHTLNISKWPLKHIFLSFFFYLFKNAIFSESHFKISSYCNKIMYWFWQTECINEIKNIFIFTKVFDKDASLCINGFYTFFLFLEKENFYLENKNFLNEKLLYNHSINKTFIFSKENLLLFFEIVNIFQIKGDQLIKNCFTTVSLDPLKEYLVDY